MRTNTTKSTQSALTEKLRASAIPEIQIQRPDGSWKPIAACVAAPEQFETTLPSSAVRRLVQSARQSNIALERVLAAIKQSWNS